MKRRSILITAVILAACAGAKSGAGPAPKATANPAIINGRDIFTTGRDIDGVKVTASPAPLRPSCAACHRVDGSGGVHLPGGAVSADLRHKALVNGQKIPYTVALLERALATGVDNTGEKLNRVMPHWHMSQRDLHDVAEYVLTQLH